MAFTEIIAYSLFTTSAVTIVYVVLLAAETRKGVRFGKKFRQCMDRKITQAARQFEKKIAFMNTLYERGIDEVEKDLIDPVTKPIIETQQRYTILKTGERDITYTGKKHASEHLRQIAEMHKESKKKKRKRKKKKQQTPPELQQPEQTPQREEVQPEQKPENRHVIQHNEY